MSMRRSNRYLCFVSASCLMMLAGCATTKPPIVTSAPVFPPDQLMKDCPSAEAPPVEQRTYGGLVKYVLDQKKALDACNADKAALRQWKKEVQATVKTP